MVSRQRQCVYEREGQIDCALAGTGRRIGTDRQLADCTGGADRKRGLLLVLVALLAVNTCSRSTSTGETAPPPAEAAAVTDKGSAKLSWIPPTSNTDGSKLTKLAGYKIYYGTSPQYLQRTIDIKDPGVTEYTIENLPPYTYYFVITAYNTDGSESSRSNIVTKTVK